MSKRFPAFQPSSFASKKPKLDISIGRRDVAGPSNIRPKPGPSKPSTAKLNINTENLFDDADDDVILIASQHVEVDKPSDQYSQQILFNESVSEMTFSNFGQEIPTSTQMVTTSRDRLIPPPISNDAFDNIEKYFEDEIELKEFEEKETFKVPKPVPKAPEPKPSTSKESSNYLDNRRSLKEREGLISQVNYLTEKTATYKQQVEKLTKDASDFNDKIQTKEGEVSLVRHQLRQVQQQNEKLCLEKMQEIDNIKKEWQEKITELERVVKAQQNELEFKNVEIVNLKSSKMNETQRTHDDGEKKKDFKNIPGLQSLNLELEDEDDSEYEWDAPPELFKKRSYANEIMKFRDAGFNKELEAVQSALSQMSVKNNVNTDRSSIDSLLINSLKESLSLLLRYVRTLDYMKSIDTNATVEYKFLSEKFHEYPTCPVHEDKSTIYQDDKLYPAEKAEIARRLFAAFAIACKYSPAVCQSLLTEEIGNKILLEVLIQALKLIGFSKEVASHFGLLESLITLLHNFLEKEIDMGEKSNLITQYIRELVFCRPTYRPLVQLSKCLHFMTTSDTYLKILNTLCVNSPLGTFVYNDYYKIFQFSPSSCVLQVYAALLETAFPQGLELGKTQLNCLLQICSNHIKFLHICLEKNLTWVLHSESSPKNCDCYVKVVNSFVILFYNVLNRWNLDPKSLDFRMVSEICRCGVLLLYETFCKNFRRGSSVINQLYMIHSWLDEHKRVFHFRTAHNRALECIIRNRINPNPIRSEGPSVQDPESVAQGDEIWDQIFDNFIK